ncbi:hypothetical protein GCM10010381_43500 [Streptomyces xantholiticus]|nr:hypothetical protein GCM10010381_43500 [Streptomyces xantholiticus]
MSRNRVTVASPYPVRPVGAVAHPVDGHHPGAVADARILSAPRAGMVQRDRDSAAFLPRIEPAAGARPPTDGGMRARGRRLCGRCRGDEEGWSRKGAG